MDVLFFYKTEKFDILEKIEVDFPFQVAILIKMKMKSPQDNILFVALTHLKAKPGFEDIRLQQGAMLIDNLFEFTKGDKNAPCVIAGDFNDIPSSLVCRYMEKGKGSSAAGRQFASNFQLLKSAYKHYDFTESEPYTTFKKREVIVKRTIDYLFYTPGSLTVSKLLEIPTSESLTELLPFSKYPSDHLSIMAEFQFTS